MNKRKAELLAELTDLTKNLALKRYRLALVCGEISSGKSRIAQQVSEQGRGRYIDLVTDLLPRTTMLDFTPTLGAYGPEDLVGWILREAAKEKAPYMIVDQIEPLLATFGRTRVVQFFQMIGQAEPRNPVILITYLEKEIEESAFPRDRLLYL